ncbi:MAG TPA: Stp1/IreP family PP2C-type Ser/Thr phosphatase [Bdellovibrionota bacterium]|nr:Stp1/IreP family PP2C-type Ser/Thr phosphatase [Bdellovibrionota bacterium]
MAKRSWQVCGKTDIGQKRTNNQDSILVNADAGLFAVADGMGGHSGGEVASSMAVKTLEHAFVNRDGDADIPKLLERAISECNKVIYDQSQKNPQLRGMGTTLTAAYVENDILHIGQVGDSRLYLYQDENLYQLTEDHSQVYELLKAGLINENSMESFQKNIITRSVGYERDVRVDLFQRPIAKGDRYLICSDGLSGMVSDEQIAQVLHNFDVDTAVRNLVALANAQGGEDNVSVIVIEIK